MPGLALAMWAVLAIATVGVRVAIHRSRTGSSGLAGANAPPSATRRLAEGAHVGALCLGLSAPILVMADVLDPIDALDEHPVHAVGVALFIAGTVGIVVSQSAMGGSWRIGTDPAEHTDMVTTGPFAYVRNPIFTSLLLALLGLAMVCPSVVALASLPTLTLSVELETRKIEEPHLLETHGEAYAGYARRVGRFFPGVGRLA